MKSLCWFVNRDNSAQGLIQGWNRSIGFDIEETAPFSIEVRDGKVSLQAGKYEKADLVIRTTKENFQRVLKGEFQFEEAFIRKKFEAIGPVHDAAKFKRMIGLVFESNKMLIKSFRFTVGRFL